MDDKRITCYKISASPCEKYSTLVSHVNSSIIFKSDLHHVLLISKCIAKYKIVKHEHNN